MKKILVVLCSLLMVVIASTAWSHMLTLNVDNYYPKVGESIQIEVGWGHNFPKDAIKEEGRLKRVYAVDPEGGTVSLKQISISQYELTVRQKGVYLVFAEIHPGVYTKTTDGPKKQTKKGLKNVIKCGAYDMRTKAVIIVGKKDQGFLQEADNLLETIPLQSPGNLTEGDILPVEALYRGEPLSYVYLYGTYVGFSEAMETYAFTTMTDKEGRANIKLLKKGVWLIKLVHKTPYPDPEECDEYSYCSTLSFEVK